jgi:hypothetical protein
LKVGIIIDTIGRGITAMNTVGSVLASQINDIQTTTKQTEIKKLLRASLQAFFAVSRVNHRRRSTDFGKCEAKRKSEIFADKAEKPNS